MDRKARVVLVNRLTTLVVRGRMTIEQRAIAGVTRAALVAALGVGCAGEVDVLSTAGSANVGGGGGNVQSNVGGGGGTGGSLSSGGGFPVQQGGGPISIGETGGVPISFGGFPVQTGGAPANFGGYPVGQTGGVLNGTGGYSPLSTGGSVGALGSPDNPWPGCIPDFDTFVQTSRVGESCAFATACASTVPASAQCHGANRVCQDGILWGLNMQALDCPYAVPDAGAISYTDCATALQSARSGDTCAWQGVCAKPSSQACCVELAACQVNPAGVVLRAHICAPGCEDLAPLAGLATATGCPTGDSYNGGQGRPCEGNFVCVGGQTGQGSIAASASDLTWCDHGVVIGGTTYGWLAYIP